MENKAGPGESKVVVKIWSPSGRIGHISPSSYHNRSATVTGRWSLILSSKIDKTKGGGSKAALRGDQKLFVVSSCAERRSDMLSNNVRATPGKIRVKSSGEYGAVF